MSLSDGDPADNGDVWFRIITQEKHINRGRVHHSAFGANAIAPPDARKNRKWDREMSGRLRSRAGSTDDLIAHATRYCDDLSRRGQGTKTFSGVMYVRVRDSKQSHANILTTAVHYTPLADDEAHADLTFRGWHGPLPEDRERFILWLTEMLSALHHPGQLQHLPSAEQSTFERIVGGLRSLTSKEE